MKKGIISCALALLTVFPCKGSGDRQLKLNKDNIDEIISAMTLEEKCHILLGVSQEKKENMVRPNIYEDCMGIIPGCAGTTYPIPRLGIPAIVMADGPAGLRINPEREGDDGTYFCTAFPIATLLASTWDTELMYEVGRAFGEEVREYGVDIILGPGINIQRNPLCGRNFEYFSEDPLVTGKMAAAEIRGLQSCGIGACPKHFAANNCEINRFYCDSRIDTRTLREIYLKGFETVVKESRPWTIMTSYNYLNGRYTSENPQLTETLLRGEWGFDGCVITDWGSGQDAVAQVVAGNDNIQSGRPWQFKAIYNAAKKGILPEETIDRNVRRILELIVRCPRFNGYGYSNKPDLESHYAISRRAATEGEVLLRNEDSALPLKGGSTIALFGSATYKTYAGGKGSGDVNKHHYIQLPQAFEEAGFIIDPIPDRLYRSFITEEESKEPANAHGMDMWPQLQGQLPEGFLRRAVCSAAESSNSAIITLCRVYGEGTDRHIKDDFNLTKEEHSLIDIVSEAFHAAGKKVCVIISTGAPIEVESWKDKVDAILLAWQTGIEGGRPIVDVLSGKICPSGRLAQTFPVSYGTVPSRTFPELELSTSTNNSYYRKSAVKLYEVPDVDYINYTEGLFVGYRHYVSNHVKTSYPFGFGLSYTTFRTSSFKAGIEGDIVKASAVVRNTGGTAGREVVQLYVSGPAEGSPARELKAFAKTPLLEPGEQCTVTLDFPVSELAVFDSTESAWVICSGCYMLHLCRDSETTTGNSASIKLKNTSTSSASRILEPDGPLYIK